MDDRSDASTGLNLTSAALWDIRLCINQWRLQIEQRQLANGGFGVRYEDMGSMNRLPPFIMYTGVIPTPITELKLEMDMRGLMQEIRLGQGHKPPNAATPDWQSAI